MEVNLTVGEQARIWAKGTNNLEAYLKLLEARECLFTFNRESNVKARQLAKEAADLDPQYALAYTTLGFIHLMDVWFQSSKSPKESITEAFKLVKKSISMDENLGKAHGLLGLLYTMIGQPEKGILEAEKGVSLEPNSDMAQNYLGLTLRFGGRSEEAIPIIKKAIRLSPFNQSAYLFNLGLSYLNCGQYEEAIEVSKKATIQEPNSLFAHVALTAAYSLSGRDENARKAASELLRIDPNFSVENYSKTLPYKNQADRELVINALRKAGLK